MIWARVIGRNIMIIRLSTKQIFAHHFPSYVLHRCDLLRIFRMASQNHSLGALRYHSWTGARAVRLPPLKLRILLDTVLPAGDLFPPTAHTVYSRI
jgi:hypothetical protein